MKTRYFILLVMILGASVMAFAWDYIDDVYYWDTETSAAETYVQPVREESPAKSVEVTFIEDSITQRSDTVVRAVIRR